MTRIRQPLNDLVVLWVGSRLVQYTDWFTIQGHEISFESEITDAGDVLTSPRMIVFEEQIDRRGAIPQGAVQGNVRHIAASGQNDGLSGLEVSGGTEIHVVSVAKQFKCLGGRV